MNKLNKTLLLLLLAPTVVTAQSLTLLDYKEKVLKNDEYLQMSQEGLKIAKANRSQANILRLPQLDIEGNYALDFNSLGSNATYNPHNYGANLVLSQVIYSGGSVGAQNTISELQETQAEASYSLTEDQILLQAEKYYWSASANAEFYKVTEEYKTIVQGLVDIIQTRFVNGKVSKTDLVMVQTRMKEAEAAVLQSRQSYTQSFQRLNMLMGTPQNESPATLEQILSIPEELALVDTQEAIKERPDFKNSQLDLEIQKQNRKASTSKVNPKIYIGARGGYGTLTPNFDGCAKLNGSAFVSVQIPVFHWNERGAINKQTRSAILSSELALDRKQREIELEINQALVAYTETQELIKTAQENMKLADENLELTTFSYNEGRLPIVDVLSAQLSWIQAQNNLISAFMNHKFAISDYKKAISRF